MFVTVLNKTVISFLWHTCGRRAGFECGRYWSDETFTDNLKISLVLFSIVLIVNTPHRKTKVNVTLVRLFIVSIIYFHFKERVCNSLETRVWSFLANATQTGVNNTFIRDH